MNARGLRTAVIALLAVEVLDELVFGAREAAWRSSGATASTRRSGCS